MNDTDINKYLTKYYNLIKREVSKRLTGLHHPLFDVDDITQETLILLFKLLKNRYKKEISSPDTFISTHFILCIYKAIMYYKRSLYYTGKHLQNRPGTKKVDDLSFRISSLDFDNSTDYMDLDDSISENNIKNNSVYNYINKYISDKFNENVILEKIYCEQLIVAIKKKLNKKQNKIFDILISDNENPKFVQGASVETKYLDAKELAYRVGYKSRQSVSTQIGKIREIVLATIKEFNTT